MALPPIISSSVLSRKPSSPNGLGHADLLKPGIVGAEHHLMPQAPVNPGNGDIPSQHLGIELPGVVKIEGAGVRIDVGILYHQHGGLPHPGPFEVGKADTQPGMLRGHGLKGQWLAIAGQGIRLPAQTRVEEDGSIVLFADGVYRLHHGVGGHHMVPSGVKLQPLELQAGEGILQLFAGWQDAGIHAGKNPMNLSGAISTSFLISSFSTRQPALAE